MTASGAYTLIRKLATGGMAEVFLARVDGERGFKKQVVLKRILPDFVDDPVFIESFLNEAKLAAQLSHPNIVHVYELGRIEQSYVMVMEFIHGLDLGALIQRTRRAQQWVPLPVVVQIMTDLCAGLEHAHNAKDLDGGLLDIVHRDVTPSNIIVSYEGLTKIVDFGIAKATARDGKTKTGVVRGKFAYLSPEQIMSQPIDRRTDVFALGIVLSELLVLKHPFRADADYETMQNIVEGRRKGLLDARPEVAAFEPIVARMLAREKQDRFASCAEVLQAINDLRIAPSYQLVRDWIGPPSEVAGAAVSGHVELVDDTQPGEEGSWVQFMPEPKTRRRTWPWVAASVLIVGLLLLLLKSRTEIPQTISAPPPSSAPVSVVAASLPAAASEPVKAASSRPAHTPVAARKTVQPPAERPPAPAGTGRLRFVVSPWGVVSVDGKPWGETPLPARELPAGKHVVLIVQPDSQARIERTVDVTAGQDTVVRESFGSHSP